MAERRNGRRWGVILAGGEGERLRPLTRRQFGMEKPKQYCAFTGSRTMIEHTIDRALMILEPERLVTVIGRGHQTYLDELKGKLAGQIIEQPRKRDTAPGVLLPLAHVMACDPDATALVFPSDHFVFPEERFAENVERAAMVAEGLGDRLVLLGALPEGPETQYGWIEPGTARESWSWSSRQVASDVVSFHEKPSPRQAENYFYRGYLWNTMILAVRAGTLWNLCRRLLPAIMERFDSYLHTLQSTRDRSDCARVLERIYTDMPAVNFSDGVLARIPNRTAVLPMVDVEWSDWGSPERISQTLELLRRSPASVLRSDEQVAASVA